MLLIQKRYLINPILTQVKNEDLKMLEELYFLSLLGQSKKFIKSFLAENVRGLLNHDKGRTLETIKGIIDELSYFLVEPRILKAIFYQVPQKRERLFLVAIRKDLAKKTVFK